ncbi:arginine biosynthesis bifunctional protein ArgJ [Marinobacterium nitratireducens]|uniref:Arginine biosynthesis bifunctional protein ArgJ n=1 Tax=Marinobacterium nitratireducens TaxID=518897 RepID=A0A918DSS4_9GAMM|nr:bifunctional glutamate N-acetyltransferase/amino-acid acetyltransferase ArgJ [Marinobacterium nitratireducens]GGO82497.1 arginine biosynthesis bifunctional protein ArgJ [Marinobacterium nitratireducens]
MAVGPGTLPTLHPVEGMRLGTASAGIKKPGRQDLVVMELCEGATVAGVFTLNAFCAAPVQIAKRHLASAPRYLLVNTGNANAGTGQEGYQDAIRCCEALANLVQASVEQVLPFSTGVIGEKLPVEKIVAALPAALSALDENGWEKAASGIMTTDTRPKAASRQFEHQGRTVTVTGISKGAGMIMPNMATMLAYIGTDAGVEAQLLQQVLSAAADRSFNRITIDGDTSTNDSCMLVATGRSGVAIDRQNAELFGKFVETVEAVLLELSHAIVRDGEGATKFVTIRVEEARDSKEALQAAYTIAHSPLVKTALFASDPNWGRILAAVGRTGIDNLDLDALRIYLDDVCIVENGGRSPGYTEAAGQRVMQQEEILIRVILARGGVTETVWTTDFSHDYVSINADYRS